MTRRSLLTLLLIGLLLASCGPSADGQPTPDIQGTIGANAETMVAALFQTQTALAPAATNTPLPTITSLPTSTALALSTATVFVAQGGVYLSPTPTGTYYTATPLASSLGVGCNNLGLVESWTEPDSPLNAGQSFTQYWQVANTGTCNWMYVYAWNYVSGDKFGETTSVRLSKLIEPGKWTTLSVNMHAPKNSGTYKASWRLTDGGGTVFGAVLPVSITVGGPTKTPKPDTAATSAAKTVAAGVAQTSAAAAQQTAVQAAINTAVAQTQTQAAVNATNAAGTATCAADPENDICAP